MCSWLRFAYRVSESSTHHRQFHGCVVVRGGRVLSHASNTGKPGRHAEIRAIRRRGDVQGATLYSVRARGGCSKPCPTCEAALREAGIATVVYLDKLGNVVRESYLETM